MWHDLPLSHSMLTMLRTYRLKVFGSVAVRPIVAMSEKSCNNRALTRDTGSRSQVGTSHFPVFSAPLVVPRADGPPHMRLGAGRLRRS